MVVIWELILTDTEVHLNTRCSTSWPTIVFGTLVCPWPKNILIVNFHRSKQILCQTYRNLTLLNVQSKQSYEHAPGKELVRKSGTYCIFTNNVARKMLCLTERLLYNSVHIVSSDTHMPVDSSRYLGSRDNEHSNNSYEGNTDTNRFQPGGRRGRSPGWPSPRTPILEKKRNTRNI